MNGPEENKTKKYLNKNSSRHHYVPQFLIKGFTDDNDLLYIYDKQKDLILKKQRSSKSIFFENDRNTVELGDDKKSSILEDYLYRDMDNLTSKTVKYFQTEGLSKIDFNTDRAAILNFFLISIYWRIPKTDSIALDLLDRSIIEPSNIYTDVLKNDPSYKKLFRSGIFGHHINEIKQNGKKGTKWSNIHQNEKPTYVIGDYPFLFRNHSDKFSEFNDSDLLFAVSSKRMYSFTNDSLNKFSPYNSYAYNAAIIHQSVKYVASGDLDVLKRSVKLYKELIRTGLIYSNEGAFLADL